MCADDPDEGDDDDEAEERDTKPAADERLDIAV